MANRSKQIGPYRRPTNAQLEQAFTTLAVEYMHLWQEHMEGARDASQWTENEKEVMKTFFPAKWQKWLEVAERKLAFALTRTGVGRGR